MRTILIIQALVVFTFNALYAQTTGAKYAGTVTDADGNVYHTIAIGTQEWMSENLKTARFNDSTIISLVTAGPAWDVLITPGYCWYDNDSSTYGSDYGALYNWYAVSNGKLCPAGWRVPSHDDWEKLAQCISNQKGPYDKDGYGAWENVGGHLKATNGYYDNGNGTNDYGFSGLPGGCRDWSGTFMSIGQMGVWWSSTECYSWSAWYHYVIYSTNSFYPNDDYRDFGFSVRCVRDIVNYSPSSDAGIDQSAKEGDMVCLNGSASSDPEGDPLNYRWTPPGGIILSDANAVSPTFTAPEVEKDTTFVFTLVVNDGTSDSPPDTVLVTVMNKAPLSVQTINLKTGWNIISFNVIPDSLDMKAIFRPLINNMSLIKVQDEIGNSLEDMGFFGGWISNIGDMALTEGYKVKVNKDCQISIEGVPATSPFKIPLNSGWNIMGYSILGENDGKAVVQELIDRGTLIKVQDESGNAIEDMGVFGGWQNNIGTFKPGEGYKIKVTGNETLNLE